MIDPGAIKTALARAGLAAWADRVERQIAQFTTGAPHGDWPRWRAAIERLPALGPGEASSRDGAWALLPDRSLDESAGRQLIDALQALHPWRKGPFDIAGVHIDSEWRSDWKWDRVAPHLQSLQDRLVLDVGCGNGYYCWRMAEAGARQVVGIDPTALFVAQFIAIRRLMASLASPLVDRVAMLPLGIEDVPQNQQAFDTVLSMGVLYHRRSPIDHLMELHGALRNAGELVLETLVIDGEAGEVLVPGGRYAKMRNVWFIPTTGTLQGWLKRCGFRDVRTVDVSITSLEEQRSSAWMRFESLADFLDPADKRFTIEGYPAPMRATLIART